MSSVSLLVCDGHFWETGSLKGPLLTFGVLPSAHSSSVDLSRENVPAAAFPRCEDVQAPQQLCSPELVQQMHLTASAAALFCITVQNPLFQLIVLVDFTGLSPARQCFLQEQVKSYPEEHCISTALFVPSKRKTVGCNQISINRHQSSIIISLPSTLRYSAALLLVVVSPWLE